MWSVEWLADEGVWRFARNGYGFYRSGREWFLSDTREFVDYLNSR